MIAATRVGDGPVLRVPPEHLAAALRHLGWTVVPPEPCLERGGLRLRGRVARHGGRDVLLTRLQTALLAVLLERHPEPVSRETLQTALYGDDWRSRHTLKMHVLRLRSLLGVGLIRTTPGGYLLDPGRGWAS